MYTPDRNLTPPETPPEYPQQEADKLEEIKELWLYSIERRKYVERDKYNTYYKIFGKTDEYNNDLLWRLKVEQRIYAYYCRKQNEFDELLSDFHKEYKRITKYEY